MVQDRRTALLADVTEHVLAHGLIGLTLRPVAAAIGTSDRMLIYHFGSRDGLVSAVVGEVNDRAVAAVDALPAARSVRSGVNALWEAYQEAPLRALTSAYYQAAVSGMLGEEPMLTDARESNGRWAEALRRYLVRCGTPPRRVRRVAALVDAGLSGFSLDLATDSPEWLAAGVDDLARAAQELAGPARRPRPGNA